MSRTEYIERLGIPIRDRAIGSGTLAKMFAAEAFPITPQTIRRLRSGITSGGEIDRRLQMAETLKENSTARKDTFYLRLALLGLELRGRDCYASRFSPLHFMESLADELRESSTDTRRCFRAMRTDMAFAELSYEGEDFLPEFVAVAETFLDDYRRGKQVPVLRVLDSLWDRQTIDGFYRLLYSTVTSPQTLRTWPPYEVEIFEKFYERRIHMGSLPSTFDRLSLEAGMKDIPQQPYVRSMRSMTGIKYDRQVHDAHINVLLTGSPRGSYLVSK